MPTRKITKRDKEGRITSLRKYSGVFEFYSASDHDKKTLYHYIQYPDIDPNKPYHKEVIRTLDRDEALEIKNKKRNLALRERKRIKNGEIKLESAKIRGELTLDEMAKLYHEDKEDTTAYNRYINHISTAIVKDNPLGQMKVKNITIKSVINLQKNLKQKVNPRTKKNYANRTINETLFVLRAIFYFGIKNKWCSNNPVVDKDIKKLENDDAEPGRVLRKKELKKLWNSPKLKLNDRLYLFTHICYYTGARPDAVINIQVKDIDFKEKKLKFKSMKKGKPYRIKAKDIALKLLKKWIKKHNLKSNNYVFYPKQTFDRAQTIEEMEAAKNKPSNYSGYRRELQKIYDPLFNEGLDSDDIMKRVSTYSLRRTSATNVYKKNGIVMAMKFLNHTNIRTTMKYINITDDELDAAVDGL